MFRLINFSRAISLVLAVVLAWAPALPALAMAIKAGDAHAMHVSHEGNHGNMADPAASKQTPCTQHESCNGQCCDLCAQCFGAVSMVLPEDAHPCPVQTSVLSGLHPRLLATSPDRPPRFPR